MGFLEFAIESSMFFAKSLNSIWAFCFAGLFYKVKLRGYKTCWQCKIDPFGICDFHDKEGSKC